MFNFITNYRLSDEQLEIIKHKYLIKNNTSNHDTILNDLSINNISDINILNEELKELTQELYEFQTHIADFNRESIVGLEYNNPIVIMDTNSSVNSSSSSTSTSSSNMSISIENRVDEGLVGYEIDNIESRSDELDDDIDNMSAEWIDGNRDNRHDDMWIRSDIESSSDTENDSDSDLAL